MGKRIERISGSSGGGGGGGEVDDVKIKTEEEGNYNSVVDGSGVAKIDLSGYIKQQTDNNKEYPQGRIIDFPTNPSSALGGTWEEVSEWEYVGSMTNTLNIPITLGNDWKELLIIVKLTYSSIDFTTEHTVHRETANASTSSQFNFGFYGGGGYYVTYGMKSNDNWNSMSLVNKSTGSYTLSGFEIYKK